MYCILLENEQSPEVAKGVEMMRLTPEDPVRAYGPRIDQSALYEIQSAFDVMTPPYGFVDSVRGTEEVRQARVAQRNPASDCSRPLSEVANLRPPLASQRAFLVAFGGRRRSGDIVDHICSYVASQNLTCTPHCVRAGLGPQRAIRRI